MGNSMSASGGKKIAKGIFLVLVCFSVSAALWVFKDLLFPFVTSKAFFFRISIELALPFYLYLVFSEIKLRPNIKNPLSILALAFLVINVISSFTGVSVTRSLFGNFERMGGAFYIGHLVALYFYILALGQMGGKYLEGFLKFFLLMAFIVTGNGIFGWLHLPTFVQDPSLPERLSSTLGNPIYLGSYLIVPLFLSLFFSFQANTIWKKSGYYFLAFLFLLGIYLSGTRGAVVGLIIGSFIAFLVYLFFNKNKNIQKYGFIGVTIFVAIVATLFMVGTKLPQGSTIRRLVNLNDGNSAARIIQWKTALKGFPERPLLGTGPENYYIIANKYYDQAIYKYDKSWFDKPHNYLLEILVTNGVLGFVVYLGLLVFIVIALYKAYVAEIFGTFEFGLLLAALLVYQIQNLFVFDTVPASLTFYSFLGFAGYLWDLSLPEAKDKTNNKAVYKSFEPFPLAVFGVSTLLMLYSIYVTNIVPMQVSANVNYGYAYATVDPKKADDYFNAALDIPFNFDKTETASKFSDYSTGFIRTATPENRALAQKVLDDSINYMNEAIDAQPDNPILWQRLSTLYLYKGMDISGKVSVDPKVDEAVDKVLELAPNREESYVTLAQVRGIEGRFGEAEKTLKDAIEIFPTDMNARIQLASVYRAESKFDEAEQVYVKAIDAGYEFTSYADMKWLIQYYLTKTKFDQALALQEKAQKVEPNNIQVFIDTANLYFSLGKIKEAQAIAQQIVSYDSTKKDQLQKILDSIVATAPKN